MRPTQQVAFFQSMALPKSWVTTLHEEGVDRRLRRAASQWRLDYPRPTGAPLDRLAQSILSAAHDLLTRGATPLCSPEIERGLSPAAADGEGLREAFKYLALAPRAPFISQRFGSSAEAELFELMKEWLQDETFWCIQPQMEIASLVPTAPAEQHERVDFVLHHPEAGAYVIEVDGTEHEAQQEADARRDATLADAGFSTLRIPASEVLSGHGSSLSELRDLFIVAPSTAANQAADQMALFKFVHQVQLALLQAVEGGFLPWNGPWRIGVFPPGGLARKGRVADLAALAASELATLLANLETLYGASYDTPEITVAVAPRPSEGPFDVLLTFGVNVPHALPQGARFDISDVCLPFEIASTGLTSAPLAVQKPSKDAARWFLSYLFRHPDFREGQWEACSRALQGKDSVVLLPTGAGKSVAFQLAALLLPGRCIVVDPIIALIDDQIDNLERVGIDRCVGITSQVASTEDKELLLRAFAEGSYLFCYVAPERFQIKGFRDHLRALTVKSPVSLIAVDEAHCVSEWGHDFRTAYLNLGRIAREYCASRGVVPPLMALTGTASKVVLKDVQRELGISDIEAIITPGTFDRPELSFLVLTCRSTEKTERVVGFLNSLPTNFRISRSSFFQPAGEATAAGLVFCPYVQTEFGVVEQARSLTQALGTQVSFYAGGPPRGSSKRDWDQVKQETARKFKRNQVPLMAATNAYGMGIDKPNIRYTAHIGLPKSIESFYQEAGRAGRDRQHAECAIILSNEHPHRATQLLHPGMGLEDLARTVNSLRRDQQDDVDRALWFHLQAFQGEAADLADVKAVLAQLSPIDQQRVVHLNFQAPPGNDNDDAREAPGKAEKALHRLVILGVVEDYTVQYPSSFEVRLSGANKERITESLAAYAASYQRGLGARMRETAGTLSASDHHSFVVSAAGLLVSFIYTHIERARRRSLAEMLEAARRGAAGEDLRVRILDYLQNSDYDARLDDLVASGQGGLDALDPLIEDLVSPMDAAALRGSVARMLGSYPDNPGLLLMRGLSEALSRDADLEVASQNIQAGVGFALGEFGLSHSEVASACGRIVAASMPREGAPEALALSCLSANGVNRVFARTFLENTPSELQWLPAAWLARRLAQDVSNLWSQEDANDDEQDGGTTAAV